MTREQILTAIEGLSKQAQTTRDSVITDPTQIAPGKSFKDLTPAEQAQRRRAYQNKRRLNGYNMRTGNVNTVSDFQPWAFTKGLAGNLAQHGLQNTLSGVKSFGTGLAKGLLDIPQLAVGAIGGLAGGIGTIGSDRSFWSGAKNGFNDANRAVGITALNDMLNNYQQKTMEDYMAENGIDSKDMSGLERAGLIGLDVANAAGRAVGDFKSPKFTGNVLSGASKGLGAMTKAVRHPQFTRNVLSGASKGLGAMTKAVRHPLTAAKSLPKAVVRAPSSVAGATAAAGRKAWGATKHLAHSLKHPDKSMYWQVPTASTMTAVNGLEQHPYSRLSESENFWNDLYDSQNAGY